MRAFFIINPAAGADRSLQRWTAFRSQFEKECRNAGQATTIGPGDAARLAAKTAPEYDVLVAVGGDGTVLEVAEGMLSAPLCRAALCVLPFGTGNDLAEILAIRRPEDTARALGTRKEKTIDVLQVRSRHNGAEVVRYALLFAGVGIIGDALNKTTPTLKRWMGQRFSYPVGLLRALVSYRAPRMRVEVDGEVFERTFLFVGASNTAVAGGGLNIAPDAKMDDGLLNVNLIEAVGPWRAIQLLRQVQHGRHITHPKVIYRTARKLVIHAPINLEVAADGELIGNSPAEVTVIPNALRVLVP
jgi:diacylglycerol kinase (ATP)